MYSRSEPWASPAAARNLGPFDEAEIQVIGTPAQAYTPQRSLDGIAETTAGTTDVYNVQIVGTPNNTSVTVLVNRVQRSVVSLIGLTVLSVPTAPGQTWIHLLALEP